MKEYKKYITKLYKSDSVKKMKKYMQHGDISCLKHCLRVSYVSYLFANYLNKKLHWNLDKRAIARGALLHDLFLYDWHKDGATLKKVSYNPFKLHGFTHPERALRNANKYFRLNKKEKDIIRNHMWPLTFFHMPRSKESMVVCLSDKYCAWKETIEGFKSKYYVRE